MISYLGILCIHNSISKLDFYNAIVSDDTTASLTELGLSIELHNINDIGTNILFMSDIDGYKFNGIPIDISEHDLSIFESIKNSYEV